MILTHWVQMTHIFVGKLTIIVSYNGLSSGRRQAIIITNDGKLLIGLLGTNFREILLGIQTFSFRKMHLKMLSAKWHQFCLGLNVLNMTDKIWHIMVFLGERMIQMGWSWIWLVCIEAESKWPPFHRQHFQIHFLEWKLLYFNSNFSEISSQGSNDQYTSIG